MPRLDVGDPRSLDFTRLAHDTDAPLASSPVVIVDGLFARHVTPRTANVRFDIFVHLPADLRLARKIQRKCLRDGFPLDVLLRNYLNHRRAAHEQHVEPLRGGCDLVVSGDRPVGVWTAIAANEPIHKSRLLLTPEEYERWMIRDCARCGRRASKSAEWSDGPICRTCYERAMRVRGRCLCCGTDRLLPGRDTDGTPICRDCAGIVRDFFCDRCGFEGLLLGGRLCEHCTLADTLARLLDDGTGRITSAFLPLVKILLEMGRPKSRLIWLRNPNVVRLLRGLATGSIPLTHDGLHQETPWRTVTHLRDLLMDSGVLPPADRQLLPYQRWLTERLAIIEEPEHRQLLRHFAVWHQMRRLRAKAEKTPLGRSQTNHTKQEVTQAGAFLAWLASQGRDIGQCQQADIDAWHTESPATRRPSQSFLRWCMRTGRMPRLTLPPAVMTQDSEPLHQHRRLAILRRVL